jgi:hypothetical protein
MSSSQTFEVKVFEDRTEYQLNGKLHSLGSLPSVEYKNGDYEWWNNGVLNRNQDPNLGDYGPAKLKNGTTYWIQNGNHHRNQDPNLGGPAIEIDNGCKFWIINGYFHCDHGPAIDTDHIKVWYNHGVIHRIDGPAVIKKDGTEYWVVDGDIIG